MKTFLFLSLIFISTLCSAQVKPKTDTTLTIKLVKMDNDILNKLYESKAQIENEILAIERTIINQKDSTALQRLIAMPFKRGNYLICPLRKK